MLRLLLLLTFLIPSISSAQPVQCLKGYQPYANRCITQRMADYISCIEATGGNRQTILEELSQIGGKNQSGDISASGGNAVVKGAAEITLNSQSESALIKKLETRWFAGGASDCSKGLTSQTSVSTQPPRKKVVDELEALNTKRDWSAMSKALTSLASRSDMQEEYNYYKGRLCVYNPTCIEGPAFFFSRLNPDSKYFEGAAISLILFARKKHQYDQQYDSLRNELREVADDFIKPKAIIPLYYFAKLMSIKDTEYGAVSGLFHEFVTRYGSVIDFTTYPLVINSGEGGVARVDWAFDVLAVLAFFEAKLAIAAHNNNIPEKKDESIRAWKVIYTRANGAPLVKAANKYFSPASTRIVLVDRNNDIVRVFSDWTYGDLFANLIRLMSMIETPGEKSLLNVPP